MQDTLLKINRRRYVKSSSFAMALLFTILCGIVALSLGYFINYFTTGHFVHSTTAALDAEIRYIEVLGPDVELTNHDNIIYVRTDDMPEDLKKTVSPLSDGIIVFEDPLSEKKYAAKIYKTQNDDDILVGIDITNIANDFKFMQIMGVSSIVFVMVVVFVSYIISVFVVSNTNKIAQTAHKIIETGDLSRRVEIDSKWDDLSNMALVLNQLLDRIEDLMHGVKHVSDNIAHDLKTPLTRLHNKIEHLEKENSAGDYQDLKQEVDHLLEIFNALLRISRIESEKQKSQFQMTELKPLVEDVIDFYTPLLQEKEISFDVDLHDLKINGDRDLLFQAYANILDNAVKFVPEKGQITIKMIDRQILISNTSDRIDSHEKERLFDRFYRADKSRNTVGTGLGLSLVKAVIELHSGSVEIQSDQHDFTIITSL